MSRVALALPAGGWRQKGLVRISVESRVGTLWESALFVRPAGLSSDLYPPRSIEGKSRTKLCQKRPQVPGLGHLQSYARFKGGKTKQGYQRMVGWCRLMVMVMADGDG